MIGKPNWFKPRTCGWGMWPCCWQGWVYTVGVVAPIIIINIVPIDLYIRLVIEGVLLVLVFIDTVDIMIRMPKDERAVMHEALADRNAAWFMVSALAVWLVYQAMYSALTGVLYISWPIVVVVLGGALVKMGTYWYLKR